MLSSLRLKSKNKDSMEAFIFELTDKKVNKWNQRKEAIIDRNQSQEIVGTSAEENELIDVIHSCLDERDGERLRDVIDKLEKPLPLVLDREMLEFASFTGDAELFRKLMSRFRSHHIKFYSMNVNYFDALDLELDWKTGKNIDELLERFEKTYNDSQEIDEDSEAGDLTRRLFLKIIQDTVENKGESAVIKLKERIESMCKTNSGDYQLLFDLWRKLFESFWYSDQTIASQLIIKHSALRKQLSKQLSFLCFIYLRNNNTELVNRLIQIFLQFNMTRQVEISVKILFDFECWRKNLDAALQIVQLCLKLDIVLSEKEHQKFLNLLLKRPRDDTKKTEKSKITTPKYRFKF